MCTGKPFLLFILFFLFLFNTVFAESRLSLLPGISLKNQQDTLPENDITDDFRIFTKVEVEASYPGGENAWRRFLEQNLDATVPVKKKAPAGVYTVIIQFVVDKEGYVSNIIPLTNHGYGMEEEVMRLLKKAPRWRPASQSEKPVKAYRKQPVTFVIDEEKKKRNRN
jgi:hypothetical protein